MSELSILLLGLGAMATVICIIMVALGWNAFKEGRRIERHLAELDHMTLIEIGKADARNDRFWRNHERYKALADKRRADHDALMRMIFERVDREESQ